MAAPEAVERTVDPALVEGVARILRDLADPRDVNAAADGAWRAPLWRALETSGATRVWLPEAAGGAGASLTEGFAVLRRAGAFALSAPLAETLIAARLLARAGLRVPEGPLAVAELPRDALDGGVLKARATAVPFAAEARWLAVSAGGRVALAAREACGIGAGANLAGEPRGDVTFDDARAAAVAARDIDRRELRALGAAARAAQMTGALEALLDMTVSHARERVAFGRPIAKFQAVQHELAKLAGETAAAIAASGAAAAALAETDGGDRMDDRAWMEVAAAKVRVGEAAGAGAAIAHQIHGAIGFTAEHVLQRYTRRLWSWRDDFGAESRWAEELGRRVAAAGADALWPTLTRPAGSAA